MIETRCGAGNGDEQLGSCHREKGHTGHHQSERCEWSSACKVCDAPIDIPPPGERLTEARCHSCRRSASQARAQRHTLPGSLQRAINALLPYDELRPQLLEMLDLVRAALDIASSGRLHSLDGICAAARDALAVAAEAAADWIGDDLSDLTAWLGKQPLGCRKARQSALVDACSTIARDAQRELDEARRTHGKEAEELRQAVEALIATSDTVGADQLQQLLDSVDARESLAYLERSAPCDNCGRIGEHDETCPAPREELLEEAAAIYHATRPTTAELLQRLRPGDTFLLSCKAAVGSAPMLAKAVLRQAAVGSAPMLAKAVLRHEEPSCPLVDTHADPDTAARSVLIQLPRRT